MSREPEPEPFLILTVEDFRRAFPPEPRRRHGITVLVCAGILTGLGALVLAPCGGLPRIPPSVPVAARPPARAPQGPPSARPVEPPAPPPRLEPEPEAEEVPGRGEPIREDPRAPWNGGRAWVEVQLRMERRSVVQETRHRVTVAWDGARYAVERPASGPADLLIERLELLLNLPSGDESWERRAAPGGQETLRVQSGDLVCRIVEGEDRFAQGSRRFRFWYSDDFPAGAVQAQLTFSDMKLHCRVLGFGASPRTAEDP